MRRILVAIGILVLFCQPAFSSDWLYELSEEAKQIYESKKVQVPCENIPELLKKGNTEDVYIAIRDAGLWKIPDCAIYIEKNRKEIERYPFIRDAVAFYFLRLGDTSQLQVLASSFDKDAREVGDHWVVELFGFLEDWDVSGRRLARHASYSDGAASELLCSAILWRRYLYGENEFKKNWCKYGALEGVNKATLDHFYETCK